MRRQRIRPDKKPNGGLRGHWRARKHERAAKRNGRRDARQMVVSSEETTNLPPALHDVQMIKDKGLHECDTNGERRDEDLRRFCVNRKRALELAEGRSEASSQAATKQQAEVERIERAAAEEREERRSAGGGLSREARLPHGLLMTVLGIVYAAEIVFNALAYDAVDVGGVLKWVLALATPVAFILAAELAGRCFARDRITTKDWISGGGVLIGATATIWLLADARERYVQALGGSVHIKALSVSLQLFFLAVALFGVMASHSGAEAELRKARRAAQKLAKSADKAHAAMKATEAVFNQACTMRDGNHAEHAKWAHEWASFIDHVAEVYKREYVRTLRKRSNRTEPIPPVFVAHHALELHMPTWLTEDLDWSFLNTRSTSHVRGDAASDLRSVA